MKEKTFEMVRCPVTGGELEYDAERQVLISRDAGLSFPVRDGMAALLKEEASPLDE